MAIFTAIAFGALFAAWGRQEYGSNALLLFSVGASVLAVSMGLGAFGILLSQVGIGMIALVYHLSRPMKKNV